MGLFLRTSSGLEEKRHTHQPVAGRARRASCPGDGRRGRWPGSVDWVGSAAEPLLADPAVLLIVARGVVPQPSAQHHDAVLAPHGVVGLAQVPVAAQVGRGFGWGFG